MKSTSEAAREVAPRSTLRTFCVTAALSSAVLWSALLGLSTKAQADFDEVEPTTPIDPIDIPPERDPLAHAWDQPSERGGFYLRVGTSLGAHRTLLSDKPREDAGELAAGFGSGFGLDVGALVVPWLALHLDSSVGVLWNGDIDPEVGVIGSASSRSARIVAFGFAPAATFFTPHDFFVKTGFGVGMAKLEVGSRTNTTDPGFYMDLAVGKDVVVSNHAAIGFSFQIAYMLLRNDGSLEDARVRQFLFGVSAAFDSI